MSSIPAPHDPSAADSALEGTIAPTDTVDASDDFPARSEVSDEPAAGQSAPTTPRRPRRSTVILSAALAVAVIAAGIASFWLSTQLSESRSQIVEQEERIQQQQREIDEQRELIERKDQFGAAMADLYAKIDPLVGLPYASAVPWTEMETFARRAWDHRWTAAGLELDTAGVQALAARLESRVREAHEQAATNASGSAWEATLDTLGGGWVSTTFVDTSKPCGIEAMACVSGGAPFVVNVSADTRDNVQMTDWIRTGVAYHEYAHVLQFTNPETTASALTAFSGDMETMADCYALTYLDGWSLEHEVPIDEFSYWEVSVGYGYTCDEGQRQVVRDWVGGLGVQKRPVGS